MGVSELSPATFSEITHLEDRSTLTVDLMHRPPRPKAPAIVGCSSRVAAEKCLLLLAYLSIAMYLKK